MPAALTLNLQGPAHFLDESKRVADAILGAPGAPAVAGDKQ